ncbi:MAG: hypothetical protein JWR80_1606 [Bradyrhizobium sp.]|nr:hypothetical protein [Bradyrhizobium sp.]
MRNKRIVFALYLAPPLAGCSTPFAGSTGMDWSGKPRPGTISVSDPKEFRREALINERAHDVEWYDKLLEDSKTIDFKPEIAREVETIVAITAALGLSFDPSAALSYRRSKETGDLQQQIDVMKLQVQLEQLRRDIDLYRARMATQTEPVNADLTTLGSAAPASTPTGSSASLDQLKAAIDKLVAATAGRLDAEGKPAALANTTANPGDVFRDREALRDQYKAARNRASLDELQDADGAALLRLNFHATIVPDRDNSRVPGVVQARVLARTPTQQEVQKTYGGWLDYVNASLNLEDGNGWRGNPDLLQAEVANFYDLVEFRYPLPPAPAATPAPAPAPAKPAKKGAKAAKAAKPAPAPAPVSCGGLVLDPLLPANAGCGTLEFAVPKFAAMSEQEGAYSGLGKYKAEFDLASDDATDAGPFQTTRKTLRLRHSEMISGCGTPHLASDGAVNPLELNDAYNTLIRARVRAVGGAQLLYVDDLARRMLRAKNIDAPADPDIVKIAQRARRAEALLDFLETVAPAGCSDDQRRAWRDEAGGLWVPQGFRDALEHDGPVSIYEVGPRSLVQQVSTVARNANSLSLAVSLAGSAPGSGVAANAAAGYSRQAMGRAAMLERLPAVVGYSVRGEQTFGWVFGPRATIDPKGKLVLDQGLREYDLSVDLSVPSWWPAFAIETRTAWAPTPQSVANGTLPEGQSAVAVKPVSRTLNTADYTQLTARLASRGLPVPKRALIGPMALRGQAVDACRSTTLLIKGENIWRSSTALVNGYRLGASTINVTPDMGGVLIDIPKLDELIGDVSGAQVRVTLLTPYGDASGMVDFVRKPTAGCKPAEKKPADGPTIATYGPIVFQVPAPIQFTITGEKLDQITAVTLNTQPGAVTASKDGKTLTVLFQAASTANLPVSRTVPLAFFKGDAKVGEKTVEVTANKGGN